MRPKPPRKTDAEYKRKQRAKAEADRLTVGAPVNAETMGSAILDTLADMLRSGDPYGIVNLIVAHAATGFRFPPQAEIRLTNRLRNRTSKVMRPQTS